ncbi:hypothetical protein DYB26_013056, partial [Aphanomyces astaci]
QAAALRSCVNREAGTIETKVISVTKDVYRAYLLGKVLPALVQKWPSRGRTIMLQHDNARAHNTKHSHKRSQGRHQGHQETANHTQDDDVWTSTAFDAEDSDDAQQDEVVFHMIDFQGQVLVDSGASSHMTGDATNLTDVRTCQRSVVVTNSAKTHATKMGTMPVTTSEGATLVMHDVLVIENMPSPLLSVTDMMRANSNFSLTFETMKCSIKHDVTTIATSTLDTKNKVYILVQAE